MRCRRPLERLRLGRLARSQPAALVPVQQVGYEVVRPSRLRREFVQDETVETRRQLAGGQAFSQTASHRPDETVVLVLGDPVVCEADGVPLPDAGANFVDEGR